MRKQTSKMMAVRYLLLMFMLGAFTIVRAQDNEIYTSVEQQPEFPGGIKKFYEYLATNLQYPAEARKDSIQGRAVVTFVVEPDGSLTDVRALRAPNASLGAEAVRVISSSPKWNPGSMNGRNVRVQYTVPIVFSLNKTNKLGSNLLNKMKKKPLFIVNGKKSTEAEMNKINPKEIQSMNVLKEKSATDKYGEEGADGVIEVTLKTK